jgi:DNA invertase Pin-like site-specific DNA recombinase
MGRVVKARRERLEIAGQLRAVIYARVSKPGDKSIRDQEAVGRRDLAEIGAVVVAVFQDKLSASRYRRVQERPGFLDTQKFIRAGKADMLWTFANNRAARDLDDYVPLRRLVIDTQTLWRYGNRTYDLTTSADRRAADSDALRSEGQSDDISENVNRGIQEALGEGRAHGKLLKGYRIIRDEKTGKAVRREPIPALASIIRHGADRVLRGESLRSVSADLAGEWFAAGGTGKFDHVALRQILINPSYAGLRTYFGEVVRDGTWEGILTVEQHKQLYALLTAPGRTTVRGTEPTHLLSFIARCVKCNGHVSVYTQRRNRVETTRYYRCQVGCVGRNVARVDAHVTELLLQLFEDPETHALLMAQDEGGSEVDADLRLIKELRADIKAFARDAAKTRLSALVVADYVEPLEARILDAQRRVDAAKVSVDPALLRIVGPDARALWADFTITERRATIRAAAQVTIMQIGRQGRYSDIGVEVYPASLLTTR